MVILFIALSFFIPYDTAKIMKNLKALFAVEDHIHLSVKQDKI